jgi:hypothetical protein
MCKSPLLWYLFVVKEPHNLYLPAVQKSGTQLLSKWQRCVCLDFVQDSVILVLRCPRALFVGSCLLFKSTLPSYVVAAHEPTVPVVFSHFLTKLRALKLILLLEKCFPVYSSMRATSIYEQSVTESEGQK